MPVKQDRTTRILLAILAAFLASFTHTIAVLLLWGEYDSLYRKLPEILLLLGFGTVPATIAILTCYKQFNSAHF